MIQKAVIIIALIMTSYIYGRAQIMNSCAKKNLFYVLPFDNGSSWSCNKIDP